MFTFKYLTPKKGLRALGIAESFKRSCSKKSILAGVVMRSDMQIDGFVFENCTVGGLDATEAILRMVKKLERPDVRVILLSGVIISYYNVIDLNRLYRELGIPLIAITYEESPGIEDYLREFPDADERIAIYRRNGKRIKIKLKNNYSVFIRPVGITIGNAVEILNLYVLHGRYVEPIRVARLLARSLFRFLYGC